MNPSRNPFDKEPLLSAWQKGYESPQDVCPFSGLEAKAWERGRKAYESDIRPIPRGYYCYKFKDVPDAGKDGVFPIISCPYLVYEQRSLYGSEEKIGVCKFLENKYPLTEDETTAWVMDQVKNCGEKVDD